MALKTEKPLFEIKIVAGEDVNTMCVTPIKQDYKPTFNEIMGVLEAMKTMYFVDQSSERLMKYHQDKKNIMNPDAEKEQP